MKVLVTLQPNVREVSLHPLPRATLLCAYDLLLLPCEIVLVERVACRLLPHA